MKKASKLGKGTLNLGLSVWFGGTVFGQVSLNPTVSSISDASERGRVLSEAWARFHTVNLPAALSALLGWRLGGLREEAELRAPGLARAKDLLLGGAALNTLVSALLGATIARRAPRGYTPVRSGTRPAPGTPPGAAFAQRLLRFFGNGSLTLLAATVIVSALIESAEPKPRGLLSRLLD